MTVHLSGILVALSLLFTSSLSAQSSKPPGSTPEWTTETPAQRERKVLLEKRKELFRKVMQDRRQKNIQLPPNFNEAEPLSSLKRKERALDIYFQELGSLKSTYEQILTIERKLGMRQGDYLSTYQGAQRKLQQIRSMIAKRTEQGRAEKATKLNHAMAMSDFDKRLSEMAEEIERRRASRRGRSARDLSEFTKQRRDQARAAAGQGDFL